MTSLVHYMQCGEVDGHPWWQNPMHCRGMSVVWLLCRWLDQQWTYFPVAGVTAKSGYFGKKAQKFVWAEGLLRGEWDSLHTFFLPIIIVVWWRNVTNSGLSIIWMRRVVQMLEGGLSKHFNRHPWLPNPMDVCSQAMCRHVWWTHSALVRLIEFLLYNTSICSASTRLRKYSIANIW